MSVERKETLGPIERNQEVVMVADKLQRTRNQIPHPYSIRPFADGDVAAWTSIQAVADQYNKITDGLFHAVFGVATDVHAERILIACDGAGRPVGTAAAWMGDGEHAHMGCLHWVAVVPEHQHRGLGRALVELAIARMADLGHSTAYLFTSAARVPAIHLYNSCGFRPQIHSDLDRHAWKAIARALADNGRPLEVDRSHNDK